jgi:outer membrane immunogenic protein
LPTGQGGLAGISRSFWKTENRALTPLENLITTTRMKRFLGVTFGVFVLLAAARLFAGPEPLPAKEMPAPIAPVSEVCNWTGLYIGVHAGYGGGDLTWSDTDLAEAETGDVPFVLIDHRQNGFFTGGQLGYNYQIGHFVIGAEGDFSYSEVRGHSDKNLKSRGDVFDTRNDWTATIAGRVGFAWNRFLLYAKGGAAFSHLKYSWIHGGVPNPFWADEVRTAPIVGGGIEYAINCNWSAKIEYAHLFFGTEDVNGTRIDGGVHEPETFQIDVDQDRVELGLNYKFSSFGAGRNPSLTFAGVERLDTKDSKSILQPAVEQICNWTGFYIGAHLGYGGGNLTWSDADVDTDGEGPTPGTVVDHDQSGLLWGGQLGYNYQIGSWFVIGAEGAVDYSEVRAHTVKGLGNFDEPNVFDTRNDWLGTIAGRVGVAWNKFLFYARGGAAFAHQKYSWLHGEDGSVDTFITDEVRTAPLVGGGVEYAINCHWSAKVEYNHLFFGSDNIHGTAIDDGSPQPESYKIDFDQNSVQAGLNYKF